jgi:hypothetical protein
LPVQARENAKMKVLLMKYIDRDDSLLSSSQLSVGEVNSLSLSLSVSQSLGLSYLSPSLSDAPPSPTARVVEQPAQRLSGCRARRLDVVVPGRESARVGAVDGRDDGGGGQ